LKTLYPAAPRVLSLLALGVATCEVLIDWISPVSLNISIIYSIPLVLVGLSRRRKLLWSLTTVLLCVTFIVYIAQTGPHTFSVRAHTFQNRELAAATITLTATLLHLWTRALDAIDQRDRTLREQNARLQGAYHDLEDSQQQIKRHNQELEQRRAEAADASERKTILLATLSHDIRNPLAAINFTSETIGRLVEGAGYGGDVALLAKQLSANTISVAHMVSDILDFSTLELGRLELHPSDFALEELIREECRILLPLAQKKGLLLSAEPMQQAVRLRADEGKLGRALANLIVNAIKYTNEGSVRIGAGLDEAGDVWFRVQDTGIGIPTEDRERIFDEFAQLHDSNGERSKGYGLGLPICRRLITLMGGSISVERASTGGSAFTVHLPSACVVEVVKPQTLLKNA
jgi:signal transduction histidine kinase